MAWRFKASKYKNATPIVPKPEMCIRDIVVGSYQTFGNNISASAKFMAFNWEHAGSSVAILPLDDCGRKSKTMPLLHAHTDTVTDLEFSPFHDGLLATASLDCQVKIWLIKSEKGLEKSISEPECTFSHKLRRVETVGFHPTSDCLLYSTSVGNVSLFDLTKQDEFFSFNQHPDVIQSLSWKQDGTIFATSCKDKNIRIIDPRINSPIVNTTESHQNIKDSRIVWLGNQNRVLTTGFDSSRLRQVIVRDIRNFSMPEKSMELDCSTGILIPLFDPDTNMLFLVGKGDTTISYQEISDKDPFFIEGIRHSGEQTKGACLVPKRALKVMEGEVNRLLQLTSNSMIPITYQVPRKTYRDFHADLFPDTVGFKSELTPQEWFGGKNIEVPLISLDPAKQELGVRQICTLECNLQELSKNIVNQSKKEPVNVTESRNGSNVAFVPIKKKIQQMENQQLRLKQECNEFDQKFRTITADKNTVKNGCLFIENISFDNETDELERQFDCIGSKVLKSEEKIDDDDCIDERVIVMVPPKPLPRTSISEQGCFEECNLSSSIAIPKPRPRSSVSHGYKPRLGPKPFSSEPSEFSLDQVFSVPQYPDSLKDDFDEKDVKGTIKETITFEDHQNIDSELIDPILKEEFKLPSSFSERRKVKIEDTFDSATEDKANNFDRFNAQRNSIAERRRIYEHRSQSVVEEKQPSPTPLRRRDSLKIDEGKRNSIMEELSKDDLIEKKKSAPSNGVLSNMHSKRTSTVFGKVSKFRHLKGTTGHKSTHIENIKNISRQISGECDGFHANYERVAVPLSGAGGKIAVFELSKTGRLLDGVIPALVNGSNVMDFQWNPFNSKQLVVACDDGSLKIWEIPDEGLVECTNTPNEEICAHSDKIYCIKFHPLAKDVLVTVSCDMIIKIWNLSTLKAEYSLKGHTDQIFGFAWSPCGIYGATVCKDGKIRIYNPRKSELPIKEGFGGPVGTRGARITYAIEGEFLVVTGFDKVSERQIHVFNVKNLDQPIGMVSLDVSPAILIPFYDEDSSTLFVTGRGDTTIYIYEITEEAPYLCPLSHHRCSSLHQGLSFLPKNQCDVTVVEFAKCLRLTNNNVEPLSFTVPRLKTELFQDDLFPPTRITWQETQNCFDWFAQNDKKPLKISLKPVDMMNLSSMQPAPSIVKKVETPVDNLVQIIPSRHWSSDVTKAKQNEIKNSVSARMEVNYKLEQDEMEGVDVKEWDE
ncbi:unnamed protein product [Diamesa serratosioi]